MRKNNQQPKPSLRLASEEKTPYEIYSILLKGITCTLNSIFLKHYVTDNIEALMKYVNNKNIISADTYKKLLAEAKDFYAVILCALFINPIKEATKDFKQKELDREKKNKLFTQLYNEVFDFFADWLCHIELDALLFARLADAYGKQFNIQLYISHTGSRGLTEIENRVLKLQIIEIASIYMIEQVAVQLGLVGLDYIDFYKNVQLENEIKKHNPHCIDTII
jgi:thiol-disulfide isomerase/thioredoxin